MAFIEAPAPWHLPDTEMFVFVLFPHPKELPSGTYAALEAGSSEFCQTGTMEGSIGTVFVNRFKNTPVGPYDELIYTPGKFTVPGLKKPYFRIPRIYVSAKDSVYNGRKNWNIPKHLAKFEFHPSNNTARYPYSRIDISLPESSTPFFSVQLSSISYLPSFPCSTKLSPIDLSFWQPPLPQSSNSEEDGLVGTVVPESSGAELDAEGMLIQKGWKKVVCGWKSPNVELVGVKGVFAEGGKWANGVDFPDIAPWSVGTWWRGVDMLFGAAEEKKTV